MIVVEVRRGESRYGRRSLQCAHDWGSKFYILESLCGDKRYETWSVSTLWKQLIKY